MTLLGVGEVLAITSIVLQVIASVDQVTQLFDRLHNAPRHIRNFRISVSRLASNFECLLEEVKCHGSINIPTADFDEIRQTLEACETLLQKYETTLRSKGAIGGVRRVFWSFESGHELAGHREQVDRIYIHTLHSVWLRLISARQRSSMVRTDSLVLSSTEIESLSLEAQHLNDQNAQGPISEQKLRDVDQKVREYTTILGVAVNQNPEDPVVRDEEAFDHVPTTLILENVFGLHRVIQLEEVQIMARDENTRDLHFRNRNKSIRVKHLVSFGSIPFTDDKDSLEVRFFESHTITVIDNDGHHLYRVKRPRYKFKSLDARRKFQNISRERELIGEFETVDISSNSRLLASVQVIRIWSKLSPSLRPHITLTFLATRGEDRNSHVEWHMADFKPNPTFSAARKPKTLNLYSLYTDAAVKSASIKFSDAGGARTFKNLCDAYYPQNYDDNPPRLELCPSLSSSLSSSFTVTSTNLPSEFSCGEIDWPYKTSLE